MRWADYREARGECAVRQNGLLASGDYTPNGPPGSLLANPQSFTFEFDHELPHFPAGTGMAVSHSAQ